MSTRRRFLVEAALAAAATLVAVGCAGRPESRATGLLDTLRLHHEHLRWENYSAAAGQVDPAFRQEWGTLTGQLGRVSDYEFGAIDMKDPPGDDASVMVRLAGFRVPDLTVRTLVLRQRWRRTGDAWKLTEMVPMQPGAPVL